jgi:hypothetical protein
MSKITTERHYKITLTGGSTYYGRTTQPRNDRYQHHQSSCRRGVNKNKHIQEIYNKYGYDDWVFEYLSTETGNIDHHNQIEFGRIQADNRSINLDTGRRALVKEEDRLSYYKKNNDNKYKNLTPEELKEYRQTKLELTNKWLESLTPKKREEKKRKDRERQQRKREEKKRGGDNKEIDNKEIYSSDNKL